MNEEEKMVNDWPCEDFWKYDNPGENIVNAVVHDGDDVCNDVET